ncbi:hypothetical protein HAX54_035251, partial [Datura stramonium]|nr:hypothetical protein [Datura stramonium]
MANSEENSNQRHANKGSVAQEERIRSEKSIEEEEGARDDSSKSNEDGGVANNTSVETHELFNSPETR